MIYVLSDIHGQSVAFFDILEKIEFSDNDTLYILGDIFDRGSQAFEIFDFIDGKSNIHLLMGNHEKMMLDFFQSLHKDKKTNLSAKSFYLYRLWTSNGGFITHEQFTSFNEDKQEHILSQLSKLPYYKKIEVNNQKFLLCHAKPIFYQDMTLDECIREAINNEDILWCRDFKYFSVPEDYLVIHGHTPVQYISSSNNIYKYAENKAIDIDCGCALLSSLGCLRLDDMKEYYSDKLLS